MGRVMGGRAHGTILFATETNAQRLWQLDFSSAQWQRADSLEIRSRLDQA
jgi:hypothetical protein